MRLEIGYGNSFEVRHEIYNTQGANGISILFFSDMHFTRFSLGIAEKIIEKVNELNPDIILLGGDYVDTNAGFRHFDDFLKKLSGYKNVFAIAGNHDHFFGIKKIREVIINNRIEWIDQQSKLVEVKNTLVKIDGNMTFPKQEIAKLTILCMHKPVNINLIKYSYNVIFSGHLHGCQFILWQNKKGLYPGRLFYKNNFLKQCIKGTLNLVSKGLGDTLPLRFNCPKDMIFVNVI